MKKFCVGLPKTGTTSLEAYLIELGYKVAPYNFDFITQLQTLCLQIKLNMIN
jgi:hypothetical protein